MLAIIRNGIAIPVMWDVLDRAGTSTTAQRSALLSRFCAVFGETAIAGLIADREFIGTAWMTSLAEKDIPFILRIKDTFQVCLADGRHCQVSTTASRAGMVRRPAEVGCAARTSLEALGQGHGEPPAHGGDGVRDVPLRSDRRRRGVDHRREGQSP